MEEKEDKEIRGWKNPYVLYVLLTLGLSVFLLLMAYLALTHDWIPKR